MQGLLHERLLGLQFFRFHAGNFVLVDFVRSVSLELVVGELDLDGSFPPSKASEYLIGLSGRVIIFHLGIDLGCAFAFFLFLRRISGFLFLLVLLLFFLLLLALVLSSLLALLLRRFSSFFLLLFLLLFLGLELLLAILLRNLHS